jgi:hypothetical protein
MKKFIFLLIIPFFFTSCKNEKELKSIEKSNLNHTKKLEIDSVKKPKIQITQNNKLETIEKENSKINEEDEEYINKALISKNDSLIWLGVNMKRDHRIFGFEKPDLKSKRLILISIFTNDVENNPFNLPYGAFYDTNDMNGIELKFKGNFGDFAKVELVNKNTKDTVYFEKKWLEFEQDE